jgi:hypothetical protein
MTQSNPSFLPGWLWLALLIPQINPKLLNTQYHTKKTHVAKT